MASPTIGNGNGLVSSRANRHRGRDGLRVTAVEASVIVLVEAA